MIRITLPTDWSDISIGKFQEIYAILKMPDGLVLEKDIKILAVLTGQSEEVIGNVDMDDYAFMMNKVSFINQFPSADHIPTQVKFDGVKYNLQMKMEKLKLAQYIDLELLSKTQDEIIYNMHKILAIFMSDSKTYSTEDMIRRADIFKAKMTIDVAYPITVFFYLHFNALLSATLSYLVSEADKQTKQLKQTLPTTTRKDGSGILFWKN